MIIDEVLSSLLLHLQHEKPHFMDEVPDFAQVLSGGGWTQARNSDSNPLRQTHK